MAARTVASKLAIVYIVPAMTVDALARHIGIGPHRAEMAGCTLQADMSALQAEVGLGVVIKSPDAPVVGRMAGVACFSEAPLVDVIRAMTVDAGRLRAFESLVDMARLAGGRCVQTRQGKACQVVIKSNVSLP